MRNKPVLVMSITSVGPTHYSRSLPITSIVPIGSGQRQAAVAQVGFDQQVLIDVIDSVAKSFSSSRHINPPGAVSSLIGSLASLFMVSFQTIEPARQRQSIMLAQTLHIPNLKACFFGNGKGCSQRNQF